LSLTQDFGQEKEFPKFILTDQEVRIIDLKEYYRGQFLNFSVASDDPNT